MEKTMVELPTLEETAEQTKERAYSLIPWLETPKECSCGTLCEAKTEYVKAQAMYMDVWKCPECSTRYYRERE